MVLSLLPASAFAAVTTSGTCGENLTWSLSDGTLTISGTGEMTNYTAEDPAPWSNYAGEIEALVLPDALTSVGSYAFVGFFTGSSYVTPADVRVPESVVRVGDYAFMNCHALNIYFIGDAPEFGTRVFTSMDTSVMHPCSNDTWASAVLEPLKGIYTEETHTSDGNSVVKAPTCCQMGYTYHTCALCSEEYVDYAEPLGHTPDANQICTRCGEDITAKDQFLWDYYDDIGGVMILEYLVNAANVTIPATIDCWPVTHINEYAFHNKGIYSVTIPNTVTNIGDYAFAECIELQEILLPDSVTELGYNAFYNCNSLQNVHIGAGLTDLNGAFDACQPRTFTISDDNPALCAENGVVFTKDKKVMLDIPVFKSGSYTVPDGVEAIGDYAFGYTQLEEIILPDSVASIGEYAFYCAGRGYNVVVDVQLGSGITELAYRAFDTANIESIELPEGLVTINEAAFSRSALEEVTIPSTVTTVEADAFCQTQMDSVVIPATVTSIGSHAFGYKDEWNEGNYTKVAGFTIDAPEGSAGYEYAVANGFAVGHTCKFGEWIVTVEPGCETNGTEIATCSCGETIESDINPLGHNFVDGVCTRCGESEEEVPFHYEEFEDSVTITAYIGGDPDVVVPETINGKPVIGINNFHGWNVEVTSVELPDTVQFIESHAFGTCSELKTVIMGDDLSYIGDYAFADCTKLKSITFSNNLGHIGSCAFRNCNALESVTLPASLYYLSGDAFSACDNLENVYVSDGGDLYSDNGVVMSAYSSMLVMYPSGREDAYTVPEGIVSIGENAFAYSDITEVTVPDSVTSIGGAAFAGCEYLREATIGNGVTELAYYNFADCYSLSEISLPESLVSVGPAVFQRTALKRVEFPEGLESIGNGVFYHAQELERVTFPSTLKNIGNNAFYWAGLTHAVMPAGVTHIGVNAIGIGAHVDEEGTLGTGVVNGFVLYGTPGTAAETYANENGIPFVDIAKHEHIFEDGKCIICGNEEKLGVPTNVKIFTVEASGKPRLTWDAVDGATKYEIYRATSKSGTYTKMYTTSGTYYTNTSAKPSTTYYYKVRALGVNEYATSAFSTIRSITCDCAAPVVQITNKADNGKPYLTWDAVDGATKYEIYRATSKTGTYTKMYTTSSLYYTNTSAKAGTTYYYKIKALGTSAYATSAYSNMTYITCDLAQPVPTISTKADTGKPYLTWDAVDGADRYEIWRATSKTGTYTKTYTTTKTSYNNTGAVANKTYYYKVRAVMDESSYASSAYSTVKSITCDCAAPVISITVKADSGKPYLTWKAVSGAEKYEIWRATSKDGEFTKLYTTTKTSYTNTGAVAGKTYYYKVKALGSSSYATSAFSNVKSITCDCARPVVTITTSSAGKPVLTWKAVSGATKYEVYRATSENGTYTKIWGSSATTCTHTGAASGTTYYYKVRALGSNTNATSAYSAVVSIKAK